MKDLRLAGVVGPLLFWAAIIVTGLLTPTYSHLTQYVSELGAKGAPFRILMNYLGIIPFGLGIGLFSIYAWRELSTNLFHKAASIILIVTGFLFIVAGFYSCDVGCSFYDLSAEALIHNNSAFTAFILASLAIITFLLGEIKDKSKRDFLGISIAMTLGTIGSFYLMGSTGIASPFRGLFQRLFLASFTIWLIGIAFISRKIR